jgi:hypothetical protein
METESTKRASQKIDKNNKKVKKVNLAQNYKNQIKLILKKKEIQEVTKNNSKKGKFFILKNLIIQNFTIYPPLWKWTKSEQ